MSRNGRARRTTDCTAAAGPRPRARSLHERRRADRGEQAFVIGILTSEADFERARAWKLSDAPDYDRYLCDTAELLTEARRRFRTVRARMFHPQDFAEFCLLHGVDPAEPAARDRYLVNPPLQTQLLAYQGEELTGDFLPRLARARENGLTLRHADLLLDGGLYAEGPAGAGGAGGGAGADGGAGTDAAGAVQARSVREAYQRGAEVFRRMLVGAGCGVYELRVAVDAPGGRLSAAARVLQWEDGVVRINDEDLELVCAVLCAGLARELPGLAVLHGSQGSAAACGEYRPIAWAWASGGQDWAPTAAAVRLDGVPAEPGFSLGTVC
ncbi:hypothetical protein ACIGZJ_15980 [Kitasatospora sp. NPDC052868]|uniref:hypothetical protein n=1 Tax=Kitasatospora sp. NPDC052868 TaxID=3364060 RepID=UPI0037CA3CA1